jgi:hypothetical protein
MNKESNPGTLGQIIIGVVASLAYDAVKWAASGPSPMEAYQLALQQKGGGRPQ